MGVVCADVYGVGNFNCGAVFGGRRQLETICVITVDENRVGVWCVLFRGIYKYQNMGKVCIGDLCHCTDYDYFGHICGTHWYGGAKVAEPGVYSHSTV